MLGFLYQKILRPVYFLIDPEFVHDRILTVGRTLGRFNIGRWIIKSLFHYRDQRLEQEILGIRFKNPVGLSAGFDKDANLMDILGSVGFSFELIGTITAKPYKGNPKPRLYRLPKSKGLVVYYGLKNLGIDKIIEKVRARKNKDLLLGFSIGNTNSKETSTVEAGIEDYFESFSKTVESDLADFYTINISCPNTFGGEPFTTPERLEKLLQRIYSVEVKKPVFIKMSINLGWDVFKKLLDVAVKFGVDGVVIGNLNKDRSHPAIKDDIPSSIHGSVSGVPTKDLGNNLISKTYKEYGEKLVIIGVGGIFSAEDAYEKIKRGASLVQLITGMIYRGPQLIGEINKGLVELVERDGYKNIGEVIGKDTK